jgi:hypothetical protein
VAGSSTSQLALRALTGVMVGGLTVVVWGKLAVELWRDKSGRRQFVIAVALIPVVVATVNALQIDHGVTWASLAGMFDDAARLSGTFDRGLAYVAAAGMTTFLCALVLVFLLVPGLGIQCAISEVMPFLTGRNSERFFTRRRLELFAAVYACAAFLLVILEEYTAVYYALAPDGLAELTRRSFLFALVAHGAVLAGPPALLWQLAKYADREREMDPLEARRLVAAYGALLEQGVFSARSSRELPASKRRLKEAFNVLVPIAAAEGDLEYLSAMGTAYGLLASFRDGGKDDLAEALRLQQEWQAMLGYDSSIADAADQARAAVGDLPIASAPGVRERLMRDIATAELAAKRGEGIQGPMGR